MTSDGNRYFLFINDVAKATNEDIDILINHIISMDLKTYFYEDKVDSHDKFWEWFYKPHYDDNMYSPTDKLVDKNNNETSVTIIKEDFLIHHKDKYPQFFESSLRLVKNFDMPYVDDGLYNAAFNPQKEQN